MLSKYPEFIECLKDVNRGDTPMVIAHTLIRNRELAVMSYRTQEIPDDAPTPKLGILWQ